MHSAGQKELEGKLLKLEADVAVSQEMQEDTEERVLKRMRRDKPYEFCCKGHEEQYRFNLEVQDHVTAAANHLGKLQPATEKDKTTLEKVKKELEKGAAALTLSS